MPTYAPHIDLGILGRHAPEQHHQLGVFGNSRPGGHGTSHRVHGADDVWNDHRRRTKTIIGDLADKAAKTVQKAIELGWGIVKHASAGPARTGIDRFITVGFLHPPEFRGDEVECIVPRHGDAGSDTKPRPVAPHAMFQPALAHHGLCNPACGVHSARYRVDHTARLGILVKGPDAYDPAVIDLDIVHAPVRTCVD